ncbi:MAG: sulfatase-like hydrolase/transferase [Candidatus Sumerlaeota bacterium]|nr:sulfatase-like hydrolase/transferase [Candidatus Sumerlaeota bacterium]
MGRSAGAAAADPAKRFNILWLIADQHTFGALGCAGNPAVQTPNLDRLAAGGARFAQATCVTPFCSPTRASWVLSRYPHSHGIVTNINGPAHGLQDPCACAENILCDLGWATGHLGKWHLGWESDLHCYRDGETTAQQHKRYLDERLTPAGDKAFDPPRPDETRIAQYALTKDMAAIRLVKSKLTPKEKLAAAQSGKKPQVAPEIGRSLLKPEYTYE